MKDRQEIYTKEKEVKEESKERSMVVQNIDKSLITISSDRVNSVYQLWSLGYTPHHIACKLSLKDKDVKNILDNNKNEWKRHIKDRINNKILEKLDTMVDELNEEKMKQAPLKAIADSMSKIGDVLNKMDKIKGGLTGVQGGLNDGDLLELGEKAAAGLGEVEVSKEIQKIRFKMKGNVSDKDRTKVILEHEVNNIKENVKNAIEVDSLDMAEIIKDVDKEMKK